MLRIMFCYPVSLGLFSFLSVHSMPRAENLHSDEEDEQSLRYLISPLLVQRGSERKGVSELMDTHVR